VANLITINLIQLKFYTGIVIKVMFYELPVNIKSEYLSQMSHINIILNRFAQAYIKKCILNGYKCKILDHAYTKVTNT
jgi:hypothetical protein